MPELDIQTQCVNDIVVVRLSGEADLPSVPAIEKVLRPLLERGSRVVVDIANLEFCSYSFLSAIDRVRSEPAAAGGILRVWGATNWLYGVLQKIGMTSILLGEGNRRPDPDVTDSRLTSVNG